MFSYGLSSDCKLDAIDGEKEEEALEEGARQTGGVLYESFVSTSCNRHCSEQSEHKFTRPQSTRVQQAAEVEVMEAEVDTLQPCF
jgi:hypothetical protein